MNSESAMNPSISFLFPGQGSQSVSMLSELHGQHSIVREVFEEASDTLEIDLWSICNEGPEEKLNQTDITQPALLTASFALWRLWCTQTSLRPSTMAGHSLGEYSALLCAGVLEFKDAVSLVHLRGQLMQSAVAGVQGGMAAILGLDESPLDAICQQVAEGEVVAPANYNSPGQVVISGHLSAVQRAMEAADKAGAKRSIMLNVSVPSHCSLMKPAVDQLAQQLDSIEFHQSATKVVHNVDACSHENLSSVRDALVQQVCMPVRWSDVIKQIKSRGITHFVELGPGKVLTGLMRRIDRSLTALHVLDSKSLDKTLQRLEEVG